MRALSRTAAALALLLLAMVAPAAPQSKDPTLRKETPKRDEPNRSEPAPCSYVEARDTGAFANWLVGEVGVTGRSRIFRDIAHSEGYYDQTRFSAELDGRRKALELIKELPLDGSTRVGDEAQAFAVIEQGVMDRRGPRPPILRDRGRMFEVEIRYPLWGESSVLSAVLDATQPSNPTPGTTSTAFDGPAPLSSPQTDQGGVTGLVVDARLIERPAAALLPRIVDENGRLVYGLETVDSERVRRSGLVIYSTPDLRTPEQYPEQRIGPHAIRVNAQAVSGATRVDLVVAAGDADRILKAAASSDFLREGRVMILMPPGRRVSPIPVQRPDINPPLTVPPADPNKH